MSVSVATDSMKAARLYAMPKHEAGHGAALSSIDHDIVFESVGEGLARGTRRSIMGQTTTSPTPGSYHYQALAEARSMRLLRIDTRYLNVHYVWSRQVWNQYHPTLQFPTCRVILPRHIAFTLRGGFLDVTESLYLTLKDVYRFLYNVKDKQSTYHNLLGR